MTISNAKRKALDAYNAKCDYIAVKPHRDEGEQIRAAAKAAGQSLQGYILQAVRQRMQAEAAGGYLIYMSKATAQANAARKGQSLEQWTTAHQQPPADTSK